MADIKTEAGNVEVYLTKYKSYAAIITQTGIDDPTSVVVNGGDSNYLGDIVWTRQDVGLYLGTKTETFIAGKTATIFGANGAQCYLSGGRSNDDVILIQANNPDNSRGDDNLYELFVEIRVYQ